MIRILTLLQLLPESHFRVYFPQPLSLHRPLHHTVQIPSLRLPLPPGNFFLSLPFPALPNCFSQIHHQFPAVQPQVIFVPPVSTKYVPEPPPDRNTHLKYLLHRPSFLPHNPLPHMMGAQVLILFHRFPFLLKFVLKLQEPILKS